MTSVNRQDAGRDGKASHPARFLLEFTPISYPFTGVYSDEPVVCPYLRVFLAPFGVFLTRFGRDPVGFCRKLDAFRRRRAPAPVSRPCTWPPRTIAGAGTLKACTEFVRECTVFVRICTVCVRFFAGKCGVYAPEKQDRGEAGTLRPSPQPDPHPGCACNGDQRGKSRGCGRKHGPVRRRGINGFLYRFLGFCGKTGGLCAAAGNNFACNGDQRGKSRGCGRKRGRSGAGESEPRRAGQRRCGNNFLSVAGPHHGPPSARPAARWARIASSRASPYLRAFSGPIP